VTPEARAARERKQKIFVVVGGLFLLALLAFQLPKLLGGSSSSAASPSTTTTDASAPAARPTPSGSPVVLVTGTETSKLTSLSSFAPKDPFVQQVVTGNGLGAAEGDGKTAESGGKSEATAKFATGKKHVAVTIVSVNGARQVLEPGMKFPASDPLFVLVAEKPGSKSIVVGIVGGAYAGGAKTTTLKTGKPVTLVNTATGARYKIELVSVGSGDASEQAVTKP
jgi:hypothetical protein